MLFPMQTLTFKYSMSKRLENSNHKSQNGQTNVTRNVYFFRENKGIAKVKLASLSGGYNQYKSLTIEFKIHEAKKTLTQSKKKETIKKITTSELQNPTFNSTYNQVDVQKGNEKI